MCQFRNDVVVRINVYICIIYFFLNIDIQFCILINIYKYIVNLFKLVLFENFKKLKICDCFMIFKVFKFYNNFMSFNFM